jgi:hypothetical protein
MKSTFLALLLGLGLLTVRLGVAEEIPGEEIPADAFGVCYHFYNCQGLAFSGGFVSTQECQEEGGLSVKEGSYC